MGFAGDHSDLTTIQSAIAKDDTVLKLLFFSFFFFFFSFTRRKTCIHRHSRAKTAVNL